MLPGTVFAFFGPADGLRTCPGPTYDFRHEILSHGPDVEVLEPEDFRNEVKEDIARMAENYCLTVM